MNPNKSSNKPIDSAVVKRVNSPTCEWAGCGESAHFQIKLRNNNIWMCKKHLHIWEKENPEYNIKVVYSEEPVIRLNNYGLFRSKSVAEVNQGNGFNNFRGFGKEYTPNLKIEKDNARKEKERLARESHNVTIDLETMVAEELWYLSLDREKIKVKSSHAHYIRIHDPERDLDIYYSETGTPLFLKEKDGSTTYLSYQ